MNTSKNKIEIQIPITVKKYEGYTVNYQKRKTDITFPVSNPNESRMVRIGSLKIYDYDHSARFIKEGQRIKIEAPFCFDAQLDKTEIELNPDFFNALKDSPKASNSKRISVYLCVDSIDELKSQQNLEEEYNFTFKWTENTTFPSDNEQQEAEVQAIKPYVAHAIPEIAFMPLENCKETEDKNSYNVIFASEYTDGYRFCLGKIIVRNLQKIPYKNTDGTLEQVSLPNLQVYLTLKKNKKDKELPTNVGYIRSNDSFVNTASVNIVNGQDDAIFGVFVDWEMWKTAGSPVNLYLRVFTDDWTKPLLKCTFKMCAQYFNDVYSLDLGTSGIVVAMQIDNEIKLLELKDQEKSIERIEKQDTILSSVSILKKDSNPVCSELAPKQTDTYKESVHILAPTKFIVGQSRIPFIDYNDETLKLENVYAFGSNDALDMRLKNNVKENEAVIKTFISRLYSNVFSRFGKNAEEIKKIIVTYPNTYTSETLEEVKSILKDNLGLKQPGQISFVPESDAVAAFYFNQRIFNGGFPYEKERVIIYDMGAGTLDLSLVEFCRGNNNHHTVRILNKIGIPIAGNYLDYIIYKGLEKYIEDEGKKHKGQIYLKEAVADFKRFIPENITEDTLIGPLEGELILLDEKYLSNNKKLEIQNTVKYSEILGKAYNNYIEVCSSTAIDTLLEGYNDMEPNTIVFSGRASQFSPLKKKIIEHLKERNNDIQVDEIKGRSKDNGLKVCVAEGALRYMDLFDVNSPHKIENKNQYAKVAVVYWGEPEPGIFDVQVRYLLEPNKENWNDAKIINGTISKDFHCNVTLDKIVNGTRVYYVQTFFEESELKKLFKTKYSTVGVSDDVNLLNWGFVNILFDSVIRTTNQVIDVELEITKDNVITKRRVGVNELKDAKILENVENNILYRHSMWPNVKQI